MEIHYYLGILRRRRLVLLAVVVAAVAIGFLVTPRTPWYKAHATVYVGPEQFSAEPAPRHIDPTAIVDHVVSTYRTMIVSEPIVGEALKQTGVQRSAGSILAHTAVTVVEAQPATVPPTNTQLLTIEVTDRQPAMSKTLANAIADAFVAKAQTFDALPPSSDGTVPALPAYVFERANTASRVKSDLKRNIGIALGLALFCGVGLLLALEHLDHRVRNVFDIERRVGMDVLGMIPYKAPV